MILKIKDLVIIITKLFFGTGAVESIAKKNENKPYKSEFSRFTIQFSGGDK